MPKAAPRPCRKPGCPEYQERDGFCNEHAKVEQRRYDKQRGTRKERGYTETWLKVRRMKFSRNPICERCDKKGITEPTRIVHHVNRDPRDNRRENLESLCIPCHNEEHKEERWSSHLVKI